MSALNFKNRTLYHGDNLVFLRGMNSETVHLIATDPPFNKNKDFHATPDSLAKDAKFKDRWLWSVDVQGIWLDQIRAGHPEVWSVIMSAKMVYGDDMAAFLCWLGVRLMEMHRILRKDGSIYLHIDHTSHAYVKTLMDGIFGHKNFRNEIVWCYTGPSNTKRWFPRKHDSILFYTKGADWTFNGDNIKIPYIKRDTGKTSGIFKTRAVLNEAGKIPEDYWLEDRDGMTPVGRKKHERTGYPTQKPLALYERIIKASSSEGDIVLDPFCGCATTPVAAEKLKRQWVGMDLWEGAYGIVQKRLQQEGLIVSQAEKLKQPYLITAGEVHYEKKPPTRTDSITSTIPAFETPTRKKGRKHPKPRTQHSRLIADLGPICQGCGADYNFDDRVLQVDHKLPKSDGGSDAYDNLTLLCPPCNQIKSDWYTLGRLQELNEQAGHMKDPSRIRDGKIANRHRKTKGR